MDEDIDGTSVMMWKEFNECQKDIFNHFCHNLCLGQWELARSTARLLALDENESGVVEIFEDLISQPFGRSVSSESITSPCQLSWFCSLELENLHADKTQKRNIPNRALLEFHLLLSEICSYISDAHLKEIYLYFKWIHSTPAIGNPLTLSASLLKFLQTMLSRQPSLGHHIITLLHNDQVRQLQKNSKSLKLVYVYCINSLLDSLNHNELDSELQKSLVEKIYKILAYFDYDMSSNQMPIRQMLSKLLEHCQTDADVMSKVKIVSVLIGHKDLFILEEFCKLDYELETNKAVSTYQACAELTEEQRWVLHLSSVGDVKTRWKMFYMFTTKRNQHVLEVIMETGLALIKCSMFTELKRLVEPVELWPLKPLLLLLGWTHCYSCSEARQLLETLWNNKSECHHPAIVVGCNKLAYQIDLIQWCLDKAKPLLTEDTGGPQFQRAADLFKGLETHSVLYVLQNSTKLHSLDEQEVLNLLQKVPLQGQSELDKEQKKTKTVRFVGDVSKPVTSLDQRKDMAIFMGYCILKQIMDVILFCGNCSDSRLTNPVRPEKRHKVMRQEISRTRTESTSSLYDLTSTNDVTVEEDASAKIQVDVQKLYNENVTDKLEKAKSYLSKLHPLTLRVEILENIFSLLFLTHEDVQETLTSEYNSDDGDDKGTQSNSTGLVTPMLSPLKGSLELRENVTMMNDSSVNETTMAYDIPFEELPDVKGNGESFGRQNLDIDKVERALSNMISSVQERKKLRKEAASGDGLNSSVSENISSMSTCSSINLDTIGFIGTDYVVRDIIAMLKLCIVNVSAVKFQLYGNKSDARERHRLTKESVSVDSVDIDLKTEEALCCLVKSSISTDSLQKHITQLERYTSEAHWRYQLVSNENIPKPAGQVLREIVMTTGDSSDEEVVIKGVGPQGRKRRRSGSERRSLSGKEKTGKVSSNTKTLSRQQSFVNVARKPLGSNRSPKLVSLMLSSPATLLTMSIRKGQFNQTKQIIKLFKLEERPETAEVYFAQAYHNAWRRLQIVSGSVAHTSGTSSNKTGLRAIANVAAAGLTTASVQDIAEDILNFPTLPKMAKIDVNENLPLNIVDIFHKENLPVMILLDLATTSAQTWDVCNNLMNTIGTRLPSKSDPKSVEIAQNGDPKSVVNLSKQRVHKIRTFSDLFVQLRNVLQLGVEDDIPSREKAAFSKTFQKSIQFYLSHGTYSLNAVKDKNMAVLFQNLHRYVDKVIEAFQIVEKGNVTGDSANKSVKMESPQQLKIDHRSRSSSNTTDRPVVHHCMKQLIHLLEKEVPDCGLVSFITKFQGKGQVRNKNYLLSLYEHCKELAYLVADSESHSRESMVVPRNYFEVLNEGPLKILGRMMFMKKMAPAKLEKVAAKLSLNLTHIIVYSCCIKIPSKRLPTLDVVPSQYATEMDTTSGKIIYNAAKSTDTITARNPQDFLHDLLLKLVTLMKDIAKSCNAQGLFETSSAVMLSKNTEFYDIITQLSALQTTDLTTMDQVQRKCFYGNLQTLMTIHCFVNHVSAIDKQNTSTKLIDQCNILKSYYDMTPTEEILFLSSFSYKVGQLGTISLFDLKYQINRCGLLAPSEWGRTLEHRLYPLSTSDPWFQLAPPVDPQMLFAVTTCCVSSPPIQVLDPAHISDQLYTSMKLYLQHYVEIDMNAKLVKIPELLLWYRKDFISGQNIDEVDRENDGLLAFIASHLDVEKEAEIKQLFTYYDANQKKESGKSGSSVEIEVKPHCKAFMCVFNFDSVAQEFKQNIQHSEKSENIKSREATLSDSFTYSLTPNTLEYIKSDCPLIATLVSLMCSDEIEDSLIVSAFDDSHFKHTESFDESIRSRTSSSMSMLDLRSYRYDKLTNDYPTLKRHLLNYIVPLAATEDPDILKGDDPILKLLTHDIVERYKANMLSLHESDGFQLLLTGLLNELFSLRKWKEILQVIDSVPVTTVRHQLNLCSLHDFAVSCLIHKFCNTSVDQGNISNASSIEVTTLLLKMFSSDRQAREVLTVCHKLLIEHNLDLFQNCLKRSIQNKTLLESIEQKYKQIKVYYRITECAKNLQFKLSLQSTEFILEEDRIAAKKKHEILDKFTDWRTVIKYVESSPKEILGLLIKCGDFDTALTWCSIEGLGDDIKLEIEENHVISALNSQPPNTTEAFMILEDLKSSDTDACLTMCRKFIEVFNKQHDVLFIADYMINQLKEWIDSTELDKIRLIHIGAQMILCLPEFTHIDYCHLVSTPRYILEQLIMNMKPELASKAFYSVVEEFRLIKDERLRFSVEQFNTLVALYAKKALEFTVIQFLEDKERSFSMKSTSSTDRLDLESPVSRLSPRPETLRHTGSRSLLSPQQGTSSPIHKQSNVTKETGFVMPTEPPPREQWVQDSATSVCMVCNVERFSMFNRRHHCRRCGRVVCSGCSGNVTQIKGINARTCDDCYRQIVKSSEGEVLSAASEIYSRTRLSDSSLTSSPRVALRTGSISVIHEEDETRSLAEVISHVHTTWKLQNDDHYNVNLREDFFFEQKPNVMLSHWQEKTNAPNLPYNNLTAPSTSLCISLLNLHGNNRECGKLILHLCDDLSKFLKPLAPGIPNPEVDYNLVMSMMKYLLFHAKIKFTKCGDNVGMGQCDIYQGMVDLLALLVIDNFRDLPSIEELRKVDSVRRLRDKLIADERLSLAMEVSTKCGLDPTGVWVTWGMMCLQTGDFPGAREKFTKCLKPVKDKNVCTPLSKVLTDIVDCLESMPGTGTMEVQILLNNPESVKNLINTPSSTFFEETSMDSQQFQECLYYLRTYGTYLSVVEFHRRHGYYMKAVQYILDHRCRNEVFVEGLLKPSIDSGELGRLTDQMILLDPSLERWNTYLTASCRYLLKQRLHHVLYEFQLFMKDFIRAGMSCFTYFYQEGARNYIDLSRRINHLFTAQQHMQAYLDPSHWGNVHHPLSFTQKLGSWDSNTTTRDQVYVRLVKAPEDVSRYIKTIALQIEITKYFQSMLTNPGGEAILNKMSSIGSSNIPTLFGSQQHRNDLTIMVLLCGDSIESSFILATRIIVEYKLGAVAIYTHVAREMARSHDYGNMRTLLSCIEKTDVSTDDVMDEILGACLLVVADSPSEAKEADNIIKMLRKSSNMINAYILCGKLKSAYLMSVKENRVDDVRRILRAAKSMGQAPIISICNKWLEQNQG